MKIKSDFILQKMTETSYVAMPTGKSKELVKGYLNLNSTGAFLWNILVKGAQKEDLVVALIENFEVDRALAENDVNVFISKLTQIGALDDWFFTWTRAFKKRLYYNAYKGNEYDPAFKRK